MRKYKFQAFFIVLLFFCVGIKIAKSAEDTGPMLFVSPASLTSEINSELAVEIKINSDGQAINSAEGALIFDTEKLEAVSISKSGSVFRFWATEPSFNNAKGTVVFAGGLTTPGYKADNGRLFTVFFRPKAAGSAQVNFASGALLANDGRGTNIITAMGNGRFNIVPKIILPPEISRENEKISASSSILSGQNIKKSTSSNINIIITSATHPDQNSWYKNKDLELSWTLPPGLTEIGVALDTSPIGEPDGKTKGLAESKKIYKNVPNGIWYFHLRTKSKDNIAEVTHYRVMIDNSPPEPFNIAIDQPDPGDWPTLRFKATDANSGLSRYEVIVGSLEQKGETIDSSEGFLRVSNLEIGEHTALVRAIDQAGNETYSTANFVIQPIETPLIKDYSSEIKPSDKFYISGTALPEVNVDIFLQDAGGKIVSRTAKSDHSGNWQMIANLNLPKGHYSVWAQAINKNGISSLPSQQVEILVSPPVFARIGAFIVDYVTVFISLIAMTIFIIIGAIYLWNFYRGRLRKETHDIERVLHHNMETLKKKIDSEIADMARDAPVNINIKTKIKARLNLRQAVDATASRIYKEVRDVRKILQ
jgi:hypothetical protein